MMRRYGMSQRFRLCSALCVPGLGGAIFLILGGAPLTFAATNLVALALALGTILSGGVRCGPKAGRVVGAALVALLALPLLTGPDVDGVARWLPLGPLALHSGMVAVPLLVVCAAADADVRWGAAMLAAAMICAAFQPDAATALALAFTAATLAVLSRSPAMTMTAVLGIIAVALALRGDGPPPQPFVEDVLPQLWATQPIAAILLGATLAWSAFILLTLEAPSRLPALASTAALAGFVAMSFLGAYPTPLIGYGAAPFIGFGLAFAGLTRFATRDAAGG